MTRLRLSRRADLDLDDIESFIARDNPTAAIRFLQKLREAFSLLAREPLLGEMRDDLRPGLRGFVEYPYLVLYRVATESIEIAGVIHGARDIRGMFERGER